MKNSQTIITIIFGFAIALLFILVANKKTPETAMQRAPQSQHIVYSDSTMQVFPIAYVNFDSLMQNYEYYKIRSGY